MKNNKFLSRHTRVCIFGLSLFLAQVQQPVAHEVGVHEQITLHAVSVAESFSPSYASFLNTIGNDVLYSDGLFTYHRTPSQMMAIGSVREDAAGEDEGGYRSFNHFYNPLNGQGLSDIPPIQGDGDEIYGRPSFIWAALLNEAGLDVKFPVQNKNTQNKWSWQNVRQYEWQGLTNSDPALRSENLGKMFRGLGDIVHLLQDASQPQHVRNEQHLDKWFSPYKSPIEKYGADHWQELDYSASTLDWRAAGFNKMQDFWDRDLYAGNAQALNDDAAGAAGKKLGLAEFSNGNFIGRTTAYAEYFKPSDKDYSKHYFPYPSLQTSTDYPQKRMALGTGVRTVLLRNNELVNRIYLDKTGDGVVFANHSALTYLGAYSRKSGRVLQVSTTIQDDNVLEAYHDLLIPKAVEYSAGLLDYYFRGTMTVQSTNIIPNSFTLLVTNTSSQDFSGGTFYLLQDGTNGTRTLKAQKNLTGILPPQGGLTLDFGDLQVSGTFMLVYRGTIGLTGGSPSDPVDANIALAVAVNTTPSPIEWHLAPTGINSGGFPLFGDLVTNSASFEGYNCDYPISDWLIAGVMSAYWCVLPARPFAYDVTVNYNDAGGHPFGDGGGGWYQCFEYYIGPDYLYSGDVLHVEANQIRVLFFYLGSGCEYLNANLSTSPPIQ